MTSQRSAILRVILESRTHPTADEVHMMVRREMPRISLSTVYRNLEKMADAGILARLELSGSQRRYDWDTRLHHHARCTQCGRVQDVPHAPDYLGDVKDKTIDGFSVSGFRLEFKGLCNDCRKGRRAAGPSA